MAARRLLGVERVRPLPGAWRAADGRRRRPLPRRSSTGARATSRCSTCWAGRTSAASGSGVAPDVLVPRPETEGLVEWAVEALAGRRTRSSPTSAPAAAPSRARWRRRCPGAGCSRSSSPRALAVARATSARSGSGRSGHAPRGRPLAPLAPWRGGVDRSWRTLRICRRRDRVAAAEVSASSLALALDGGPDGLRVLRRLVAGAPPLLRPGGVAPMEIGEDQAGALASLMAAEGFTASRPARISTASSGTSAGAGAADPGAVAATGGAADADASRHRGRRAAAGGSAR